MSEQQTTKASAGATYSFGVSETGLRNLERVARNGGHPTVESMVQKAIHLYWKILGQFGEFDNAVQLWWPWDDWGEGSEWIYMAGHFSIPDAGVTFAENESAAVKTYNLHVSDESAARINWACTRIGDATFVQLLGLAVGLYASLLSRGDKTWRGGWHLRIQRVIEVRRRKFFTPWKTHLVREWGRWNYWQVSSILNDW